MICLAHKISPLRAKIPGLVFEPEQISSNDKLNDEYESLVADLISNTRFKELWDIEHAFDGKIADCWGYVTYCMKMAHIKILQKYYWRTTNE